MSQPAEKKKPFFSCCAAEEDKNEAVIDFKDKKIAINPPVEPIKDTKIGALILPQHNSKFRFTYQSPNASFK